MNSTLSRLMCMFENMDFTYIIGVQRVTELSTSLICVVINIYFARKFGKLSTFHSGFRTVLITMHLTMATATFVHPILMIIPHRWYSLKNGCVFNAVVYYSVSYLQNSVLYMCDIKYFVIGLERNIAMKHRHTYEGRDNSEAKRLLIKVAILCAVGVAFKNLFVFYYFREVSLDERLQLTFNVDAWAVSILTAVTLAFLAYIYGLYEFHRLAKFAKSNYYSGKTLTESFQIKQIKIIVDVLWPIMIAFAIIILLAFFFQSTWMYYHFVRGLPMTSNLCQSCITCIYLLGCIYNNYSTLYLMWFFKPMRQALISDIFNIFGLKTNEVQPATPIDYVFERENHFQQLERSWEVQKPLKR